MIIIYGFITIIFLIIMTFLELRKIKKKSSVLNLLFLFLMVATFILLFDFIGFYPIDKIEKISLMFMIYPTYYTLNIIDDNKTLKMFQKIMKYIIIAFFVVSSILSFLWI